jgi:pilus assembly protein CpaB
MVIISLAVLLAALGTFSVFEYVQHADARAVAGKRPVTVLVAARRVPAGTAAGAASSGGYLRAERLPAESTPADALLKVTAEMADLVAEADIPAGQVVLRQMFSARRVATGGLAIPAGRVAVSVSLKTSEDVAGYVQAGCQIAVFDTFVLLDGTGAVSGSQQSSDKSDNWATKLLLPRVDVLAVSQPAPGATGKSAAGGSGGSDATLLVTVAVNQADAERLVHVMQTGNPYLALLSDTSQTAPGRGVDNHGVLGPIFAK